MHSQRLNEILLTPWVIAKHDGTITAAHCDCIAGLAESCTHIAAVLFSIDISIRNLEVTVTGKRAYWVVPTNKPAEPAKVAEVDLQTPKKRCRTTDEPLIRHECSTDVPSTTEEEKRAVLRNLMTAPTASVLHTTIFTNSI